MTRTSPSGPSEILHSSRVGKWALYLLGSFDQNVTASNQQIRALNLAYALVEDGVLSCSGEPQKNIAIVGGGFAGLTIAAGLLKKGVKAHITIFEQCDTLLPLQQGSDSRWLHPRIYDWPKHGSQSGVAMLPVLNWTAARASDVVVQMLTAWERLATDGAVSLYCNTRHLEVFEDKGEGLIVEWVGECRSYDGTAKTDSSDQSAEGGSKRFDIVVLATGFGIEQGEQKSYWRNEALAQPSLDKPRRTFLIVGQGDGAMIDLLRLRISQYRQDRILDELFRGSPELVERFRELDHKYYSGTTSIGFFGDLERLLDDVTIGADFKRAIDKLRQRLRRDTSVVLRCKVRKFSELIDSSEIRISFQNRLLVYMLFKCGGFTPSDVEVDVIKKTYAVPHDEVVYRTGVDRKAQLQGCLDPNIYQYIEQQRQDLQAFLQTASVCWTGGYFDFQGRAANIRAIRDDKVRAHWRREYLPGPTSLVGAALSATLAGDILHDSPSLVRLRVTLHRTLVVGAEELLQQTAEYAGTVEDSDRSSAARTFPTTTMTIGLAYRCRKIVRSKLGVDPKALLGAMSKLEPLAASRVMSPYVSFVLAIPLLEPEQDYTDNSPVAGIVYIDCGTPDFHLDDSKVKRLVSLCGRFLFEMNREPRFNRIRNIALSKRNSTPVPQEGLPTEISGELELLEIEPPRTARAFQFNYDHLDIASVE
jgi:hypothetical protein